MRLQRVTNRARGDKVYHKWQVTLPPDVVEALDWQPGEELAASAEGGALVVRKATDA